MMDLTPSTTTSPPFGGFPTVTPLIPRAVTTYPPAPADFTPFTTCYAAFLDRYDSILRSADGTCVAITHPAQIQTLPLPAPNWYAECNFSTRTPWWTYYTVTLRSSSFTRGEVLTLVESVPGAVVQTPPPLVTTLTAYRSAYTSISPVYVEADCRTWYVPATVSAVGWAALGLTFFTIHLSWWVLDLPQLLFRSADAGGGWKGFIDSVLWACARSYFPVLAAIFALVYGEDVNAYVRIYYCGFVGVGRPPAAVVANGDEGGEQGGNNASLPPPPTPSTPPATATATGLWIPARSLKYWTSVLGEMVALTATALTLYMDCTLPEGPNRKDFGAVVWVFPSLPTNLIGLFFLLAEGLFPRGRQKIKKTMAWMTAGVLVAVGLGVLALVLQLGSKTTFWWVEFILYGVMLFSSPGYRLDAALFGAIVWVVRCFGVTYSASHQVGDGLPFEELRGLGFTVVYIVMGAIAYFLAVVGFHKIKVWDKKKVRQLEEAE
ncbi:hypothetical protein VTJ04DRAFT_9642 [Mycothermus thermophilus]|uniref:uncharacterized protein n=1 Tax=Humicola insolens TaxID=85995 RepID=UPI0037439DD5